MRPAPKGAVGMGKVGAAGAASAAVGAGSRSQGGPSDYDSRNGSQSSSGSRPAAVVAAAPAPAEPAFDLAGFEEKLGGGLIVTKINRQGRAKVRALFYDRQERMLWWNEPGRGSPHRSSLLSIKKEQPLAVASLIKVRLCLFPGAYGWVCSLVKVGGLSSLWVGFFFRSLMTIARVVVRTLTTQPFPLSMDSFRKEEARINSYRVVCRRVGCPA
ncbi:unnamed protein product [Ectocarpus sp. 4 AP-2014]